jgi:hypothetical protein
MLAPSRQQMKGYPSRRPPRAKPSQPNPAPGAAPPIHIEATSWHWSSPHNRESPANVRTDDKIERSATMTNLTCNVPP